MVFVSGIHQAAVKVCGTTPAHYVTLPGYKKKLREEKSLSGVLFLITQRASALHISSAASPQVIPVLSLYCRHPPSPNQKTPLALIKVC